MNLCRVALWLPSGDCSSLRVACGPVLLQWWLATWTKTLWATCSGAGEASLPWPPASSGTLKQVTSPWPCRWSPHRGILTMAICFIQNKVNALRMQFICSYSRSSAGRSSFLPDDELSVQIPGWGPDQSQRFHQVCVLPMVFNRDVQSVYTDFKKIFFFFFFERTLLLT